MVEMGRKDTLKEKDLDRPDIVYDQKVSDPETSKVLRPCPVRNGQSNRDVLAGDRRPSKL